MGVFRTLSVGLFMKAGVMEIDAGVALDDEAIISLPTTDLAVEIFLG